MYGMYNQILIKHLAKQGMPKILITMKHWTFLLFLLTKKNIKNPESILVATVWTLEIYRFTNASHRCEISANVKVTATTTLMND